MLNQEFWCSQKVSVLFLAASSFISEWFCPDPGHFFGELELIGSTFLNFRAFAEILPMRCQYAIYLTRNVFSKLFQKFTEVLQTEKNQMVWRFFKNMSLTFY